MFYSILKNPPYDIQVENDGQGCSWVLVAVASDDNRVVSIACDLAMADGICEEICWEFSFAVEVFSIDGSSEGFRTQDRNIAANYIPQGIRPSIMDVVCTGLKALLNHANPPLIYWVTKDRDPPEKALKKYDLLREAAQSLGYFPLDWGTDPFGRRFWTMRRNSD